MTERCRIFVMLSLLVIGLLQQFVCLMAVIRWGWEGEDRTYTMLMLVAFVGYGVINGISIDFLVEYRRDVRRAFRETYVAILRGITGRHAPDRDLIAELERETRKT